MTRTYKKAEDSFLKRQGELNQNRSGKAASYLAGEIPLCLRYLPGSPASIDDGSYLDV